MKLENLLINYLVDYNGCWRWLSSLDKDGYANRIRVTGTKKKKRVHRIFFELFERPIPEGLVLDHLCSVRDCVNPKHMEPVTNKENVLRGDTITAKNKAKTHCLRGHKFNIENIIYRGKRRICKECYITKARRTNYKGEMIWLGA